MTCPLFVTDTGLANSQIANDAIRTLNAFSIFSDVDSNPTEINLAAGLLAFNEGGHDGVIAFGGGSALDLGKLIALMAGQSVSVWELEDIDDWWTRADTNKIVPIIAVPTTAGTGSEVGRAGVLTNSETKQKKIIFHPKIMPTIVICDPELSFGMPAAVTAGTGMDAFAHCLEAYCSPHYHPMSQGIALEGMRLVKENLMLTFDQPDNETARAQMMSAAMMGATAFQKGLGAIHALSHPIGAIHNTHHGTTNAVLMPAVLHLNKPEIEAKIEKASDYLGLNNGWNGFCELVNELNSHLKIPPTLMELGVRNPDLELIIDEALKDPSCGGNPSPLNRSNLMDCIRLVL
jgi:alcohol dehydrogenase class IV